MERWVEHYTDLYSRENTVSPAAQDVIEWLPTMDSLASGKAPDNDGNPPDLIKHCKTTLLLPLHEVLCQCWQEGAQCTTGHEGLQNQYPIQEQGREERL